MFMRMLAVVLIVVCAWPAHASDLQFGVMLSSSKLSVSDKHGDTKNVTDNSMTNFFVAGDAFRDVRWLAGLMIVDDLSFIAGENEVGMDAKRITLEVSLQHQLALARSFQPWLGVGIVASNSKFTKRHFIASDGYIVTRFDDKEESIVGLQINLSHEWNLSRHWLIGFHSRYEKSLADGFNGVMFGVTSYYK